MRNRKIATVAMAGLLGIFTIGCSKAPDVPKWFMAEKVGYITGTGVAKRNKSDDLNFQKEEALTKARVSLAKKIKAAVKAKDTSNHAKKEDGSIESDIEQLAETISKVGLKNAKTLNSEFMDDGRFFVRIGVKKDIITGNAK
ncbi:hypothetical protein MNB_SV-14-121 [hydrothermal vent metagenome]|uniref:Lipoprotein LPP20-like domain-containing protein n=1 Tax=hydrothermal vent metagenome TaxID=652676 RepID=A0A1W1BLY2_9ZZZZ